METFSALLALCAGNSSVTGEFPSQRPVTRWLDVYFDLHLDKRLSKQSWGWWFETPSRPLWRLCNDNRSHPGMLLLLDLLLEYLIEHVTFKLHCVKFIFSTGTLFRGVPGFETDCPCGVCKLVLNDSWFVSFKLMENAFFRCFNSFYANVFAISQYLAI